MHSIVLALGIARVLGGIAGVARDWRRLETKWFFLGWLALLLLLPLGWWFGLWTRFGEVSDISLWTFFFWFLIPASLYIASRLLIPEFHAGSTPDLEQRFDEVRIPFLACLVLSVVPVLPGLAVQRELNGCSRFLVFSRSPGCSFPIDVGMWHCSA